MTKMQNMQYWKPNILSSNETLAAEENTYNFLLDD